MVQWLAVPLFAFLDRLGGGGFAFLGVSENHWLGKGHKWARRYGIPALVWVLNPTLEQAVFSGVLAFVLSTDLKEIAAREWDTVAQYGLALAVCIYPAADYYSLAVTATWVLGVFLSNIGLFGWRLGWHWVELLLRGAVIGAAIALR